MDMGLVFVSASEAQIKKILGKRVFHLKYSPDDDGDEFYLAYDNWGDRDFSRNMHLNIGAYQWTIRCGDLLSFSYQKGGVSYGLSVKDPRVIKRLEKLTKKAKAKFWEGAQI